MTVASREREREREAEPRRRKRARVVSFRRSLRRGAEAHRGRGAFEELLVYHLVIMSTRVDKLVNQSLNHPLSTGRSPSPPRKIDKGPSCKLYKWHLFVYLLRVSTQVYIHTHESEYTVREAGWMERMYEQAPTYLPSRVNK